MFTKINNQELNVLTLFTDYKSEFYIREVEKHLGISSRSALLTLEKLEKRGVLRSEIKGKIKLYEIHTSHIAREFCVLAEQYKKILFYEKNSLIREIMEKIEPFSSGIVAIFGSYAKGLENKDSDIDLFVVGKCDTQKIEEIGKLYGKHIQVKNYSSMKEDILVREVLSSHIIIKGMERFVGEAREWIK